MKIRTLLYIAVIIIVNVILVMLGISVLLQSRVDVQLNAPVVRTVNVPQGQSFTTQTLRLTRFNYTKTSHELLSVELEVENVTTTPQSGLVWYILAPEGDPEPWRTAAYTAPEQSINIDAGQRITLTFAAPDEDTPEGEYTLSVWVHGITDGQRFHSDGAGAPEMLFVGGDYSFRITEIEQEQTATGENLLIVTFYSRNNTEMPIDLEMSYTLSEPNAERPWENALYTLPFKETQLDSGEAFVVTYRDVVDLPEGEYQLIGWLHQNVRGQESVEIARYIFPELIENN